LLFCLYSTYNLNEVAATKHRVTVGRVVGLKKTDFKITGVCLLRRPKYNSNRRVRRMYPVFY